jgi:hypothetical protein
MNQINYSIDKEPKTCAQLIAQGIRASAPLPGVIDRIDRLQREGELSLWLVSPDGKTRINLTDKAHTLKVYW